MNRQCLKKFFKMQPPKESKVRIDHHSMHLIEKFQVVYWFALCIGIATIVLLAMSLLPGVWLEQANLNRTCTVWNRCLMEWNHDHPMLLMAKTTPKARPQQQARQLAQDAIVHLRPKTRTFPLADSMLPATHDEKARKTEVMASIEPSTEVTSPPCIPELIHLSPGDSDSKLPTWQIGCLSFVMMVMCFTCLATTLICRGIFASDAARILYCYHSAGEIFFASAMLETVSLVLYPRLLVETLKDFSTTIAWYSIPGISFGREYYYACIAIVLLYVSAFLMMLDEITYFWHCVQYQYKSYSLVDSIRSNVRKMQKVCISIARPPASSKDSDKHSQNADETLKVELNPDHVTVIHVDFAK